MGAIVIIYLLGVAITWVTLLIAVPVAQRLMRFSFPPWPETLWKLAVVAAAVTMVELIIGLAIGRMGGIIAAVGGFAAMWAIMYKWFDAEFMDAIIISFCSRVASFVLLMFLCGMFLNVA